MIVPALSLAAVLLAADPAPGPVVPPLTPPLSLSLALALELGRTVGGARECAMGDRADAAQTKAQHLIEQQAIDDNEDPLDMNDRFHQAMRAGRDAVLDRATTCAEVERAIKQLEGNRPY